MKIYFFLFVLAFSLATANAQTGSDSSFTQFSESLRKQIFLTLRNWDCTGTFYLDSVNFIDIHAIRFKFNSTGDALESVKLSKGAPGLLETAIKLSVDSILTRSNGTLKHGSSILAGKTFVLPILFDYEIFPGHKVARQLSTQSVANLTLFEGSSDTRRAFSHPYIGTPINAVLLPVFYYQTPHAYPASKKMKELYEKKKGEKKN